MARKSRRSPYIPANERGSENSSSAQAPNRLATGAYIRLSVENNGHETDSSLKTQIELVESYIREHEELSLVRTYIDNGYSGTRFDRPEFVQMIEDMKSGKIQCIVVKDLSRFGRDYLETGYYIESIFPLLNVRFIAITDQFDSTRESDRNSISVPIKNMVNAMYAKDFSRKQQVFREMCIKAGRVMGNYAPYGYIFSKETGQMVIDEAVAPYVRLVFSWILSGVSRIEIAKRMDTLGAPTPAEHDNWKIENKWKDSTVKLIVYNPAYAGFHVMGKSKVSLCDGISAYRKDRKEWVYFPDFHEPYITLEEYEKIEQMISDKKQQMEDRLKVRAEIREQMPDMFQGKVFCGDCGRMMNFGRGSHHRGYMDLSFEYYRCRYSKKYVKCSNKKVQQNFLKIVVTDQIRNLIRIACEKADVLKAAQSKHQTPGYVNPLERNISRLSEKEKGLEDKLLKAFEDHAEGLLDDEEYRIVKHKLSRDKEDTISKRQEFEKKLIATTNAVEQLKAKANELSAYLDNPAFDEAIVKELVNRIVVYDDGRVTVEFACADVFQNALIDDFLAGNEYGKEMPNGDSIISQAV